MRRTRRGRIVAPDFEAFFSSDGRVRDPDTRIEFMRGWTDQEVRDHCRKEGWKVTQVLTDIERAEKDPLVFAVLNYFPGAEVVAVRPAGAEERT